MKKPTIDRRFWLTTALCAALLAVPPMAVQARDRQYDAALPRPEVTGVMTDEQRLDPTVSALYKQQVLSNNGYSIGEENSHKYTQMQGKLRQAYRRGLLSDEQLDYLLALVDSTQAAEEAGAEDYYHTGLNYCNVHTDEAGIEHLELANCSASAEDIASPDVAVQLDNYLYISYLPNNGPILQLCVNSDDMPEDDVDPATLMERFTSQLNLTIPGEWEQDSDTVYFNRAADLTASNYHTAGQRNLMVQLGVLE